MNGATHELTRRRHATRSSTTAIGNGDKATTKPSTTSTGSTPRTRRSGKLSPSPKNPPLTSSQNHNNLSTQIPNGDSAPSSSTPSADKGRTTRSGKSTMEEGQSSSNTRPSRRSKPKQLDENFVDSTLPLHVAREEPISIDTGANLLASLDEAACRRALLEDAYQILEGIIYPMSFPWAHPEFPFHLVKNVPKDIDEMPVLLGMDDDSSSPPGQKPVFDKSRSGGCLGEAFGSETTNVILSATSTRTSDPGVIELKTYKPNLSPSGEPLEPFREIEDDTVHKVTAKESTESKRPNRKRKARDITHSSENCLHDTDDDIYSAHYERLQKEKKKEFDADGTRMERKMVSVRFGSVSSRSHILKPAANKEEPTKQKNPVVFPASLPLEVQSGRSLIYQTAVQNAAELGSFDCRYATTVFEQEHAEKAPKVKRISTGRTRLLWTKIHLGNPPSGGVDTAAANRSRVFYTSSLTGQRMDPGCFKRPRNVLVGVRVNGSLVSDEKFPTPMSPKSASEMFEDVDPHESVGNLSGISERAYIAAITAATRSGHSKQPRTSATKPSATKLSASMASKVSVGKYSPVCAFEPDPYRFKLLKDRRASRKFEGSELEDPLSQLPDATEFSKAKVELRVLPQYECLPLLDGRIRVVCTAPGNLKPCWLPSIFGDIHERKGSVCSVCGQHQPKETLRVCSTCKIVVHESCYSHPNKSLGTSPVWACVSCQASAPKALTKETSLSNGSQRKRKSRAPARFRTQEDEVDAKKEEHIVENPVVPAKAATNRERCKLCPHLGGSLSYVDPTKPESGFVHDLCQAYAENRSPRVAPGVSDNQLLRGSCSSCSICGSCSPLGALSDGLVNCHASGCAVLFHPMCAKVVSSVHASYLNSALREGGNRIEDVRELDSARCNQYLLTTVKVASRKEPSKHKLVPIALCGMHNPQREASFYGCYPCGDLFSASLKIPSRKRTS